MRSAQPRQQRSGRCRLRTSAVGAVVVLAGVGLLVGGVNLPKVGPRQHTLRPAVRYAPFTTHPPAAAQSKPHAVHTRRPTLATRQGSAQKRVAVPEFDSVRKVSVPATAGPVSGRKVSVPATAGPVSGRKAHPNPTELDQGNAVLMSSTKQLSHGALITLRNVAVDGCWISPPYHRRDGPPQGVERVLRLQTHKWKGLDGWAIRSHLGTYLVEEVNHAPGVSRMSLDRRNPRSMEHFGLECADKGRRGVCVLRSLKSQRVATAKAKSEWGVLSMKVERVEPRSQWYVEIVSCDEGSDCQGRKPGRSHPDEWTELHALHSPTLLFTSPKLPDTDETMLNQLRSFDAWRSLAPHVRPVVVSQKDSVLELARSHRVDAVGPDKVEVHQRFKEPTYRGLFRRAFQANPTAQYGMYTNSDLVFTSSLLETLDAVLRFANSNFPGRPLFMVGQRTNVDVPSSWRVGTAAWESEVEEMERRGNVFQTDAEDYFLVSRGIWNFGSDIPDFVVGGRAFDNWLVNKAVTDSRVVTVDASRTLIVIHQNHDANKSCGRYCSHRGEKRKARSDYNGGLAKMNGGWGKGRTTDCQYATVRTGRGVEVLRREFFYLD